MTGVTLHSAPLNIVSPTRVADLTRHLHVNEGDSHVDRIAG